MDPAAWQSSQAPASKGGGSTQGAGMTRMVSDSVLSFVLSLSEFIFSRAPATTLQSRQTPGPPCLGVDTSLGGLWSGGPGAQRRCQGHGREAGQRLSRAAALAHGGVNKNAAI